MTRRLLRARIAAKVSRALCVGRDGDRERADLAGEGGTEARAPVASGPVRLRVGVVGWRLAREERDEGYILPSVTASGGAMALGSRVGYLLGTRMHERAIYRSTGVIRLKRRTKNEPKTAVPELPRR